MKMVGWFRSCCRSTSVWRSSFQHANFLLMVQLPKYKMYWLLCTAGKSTDCHFPSMMDVVLQMMWACAGWWWRLWWPEQPGQIIFCSGSILYHMQVSMERLKCLRPPSHVNSSASWYVCRAHAIVQYCDTFSIQTCHFIIRLYIQSVSNRLMRPWYQRLPKGVSKALMVYVLLVDDLLSIQTIL